jgi:RNA polymerase sigma-70 factor (ECF subfamily)
MTELDLRQVFNEHKDAVYGFALRMTGRPAAAEDIAQDCFLELLRHPGRFDPKRGSLRAYLLGVTRNLALKRWRTEQRLDALDDDVESSTPDLMDQGVSMLINATVQSLPPLQREAVLLFEYERLTLEEIAEITNTDVGAVKSRLHRARERLRIILAPLRNGTRGRGH